MESSKGFHIDGTAKGINGVSKPQLQARNALRTLGNSIAKYFMSEEKLALLGKESLTIDIIFNSEGKSEVKLSKDFPEVLSLIQEQLQPMEIKDHALTLEIEAEKRDPMDKLLDGMFSSGGGLIIVIAH